jgi:hypothetical protein
MSEGRIIERQNDGYTFRYYESPTGKHYTHYDCESRAKAAVSGVARWLSRALRTRTTQGDAEQDRYELERLRYIANELAEYAAAVQVELDRLEGVDRKRDRIAALRMVEGRPPEEAALFLAKADQLEAG